MSCMGQVFQTFPDFQVFESLKVPQHLGPLSQSSCTMVNVTGCSQYLDDSMFIICWTTV